MKTGCDAGGIGVPMDVRGVLFLTRESVPAIVDLRSSDTAQAFALSEEDEALRRVEAVEA